MQGTVRRNEDVVGKWTDGLSRETGDAIIRDVLEFEGFRSHDRWMSNRDRGRLVKTTDPLKIPNGKVIAHANGVPSPEPFGTQSPSRSRRTRPGFHRRSSIQLAARVGKR